MNTQKEELWRPTLINPDIEVSNLGNVRKKATTINMGTYSNDFPPQLLRPFKYGRYLCVNFDNKTWPIHRLVAETFVPNSDKSLIVIHKDSDDFHNEDTNLIWVTRSEAMKLCRQSKSYRLSSGKCIKVICENTGEIYDSIKSAVQYIKSQDIKVNYDTFLRHIKKNNSFEISKLKFTRYIEK